jgi:hypothetical protein
MNNAGSRRASRHGWFVMVPSKGTILHPIDHSTVLYHKHQRLRPMPAGPTFDELMKPKVATQTPTRMQQ